MIFFGKFRCITYLSKMSQYDTVKCDACHVLEEQRDDLYICNECDELVL